MNSRDDDRRQADLDWLYGAERPSADQTKVMDSHELAELERRRAKAAATGAQAAQEARAERGRSAQRVVHSEREFADRPAQRETPRAAAPRQPQPATAPRPAPAPPRERAPRSAAPPPRAPRPRAAAPRPRRRRGGLLRLIPLALVAWIVWLLAVPVVAVTTAGKVDERPEGERPANQPGTTTLLVGSDGRDDLSPEQQAELGTGTEVGKRTDTMMLLHTPKTGKPVLVSLPRDSYVDIPGHGRNKLNAAYALGGPQLLVSAIEQDTGLRVDGYLEVGFDGFANVVDALGGVEMCLDEPMNDKDSHTDLPAGCQELSGTQALGYVRMRKADPRGDLGRMERQREMIGAITKEALSPWTFINPVRYWRLNMAAGSAVQRGHSTGPVDAITAANSFRQIAAGKGLAVTVPLSSDNATTAAGSSVIWDEERAQAMFEKLASGNTEGMEEYAR